MTPSLGLKHPEELLAPLGIPSLLRLHITAVKLKSTLRIVPLGLGKINKSSSARIAEHLKDLSIDHGKRLCMLLNGDSPAGTPVLSHFLEQDCKRYRVNAQSLTLFGFKKPAERRTFSRKKNVSPVLCRNRFMMSTLDGTHLVHRCDHFSVFIKLEKTHLCNVLRWLETPGSSDELKKRARRLRISPDALTKLRDFLAMSGFNHPPGRYEEHLKKVFLSKAETWRSEVPYYTQSIRNLRSIPILEKREIVARWNDFTSKNLPKHEPLTSRKSSGSSLQPSVRSVVETSVEAARASAIALINPEAPHARSISFVRPGNIFGEQSLRLNQFPIVIKEPSKLILSPGHNPTCLDASAMDTCLEHIVKFNPTLITGEPAYLYELSRHLERRRSVLNSLSYVEAGHGYLWSHYRNKLREVLKGEIRVHLHTSEVGSIGYSCDFGHIHLLEKYLYLEILDGRRKPVPPNKIGDLIVTTLDTKIRPLLRYAIGDRLKLLGESCACGRPFRIVSYVGRASILNSAPMVRESLDYGSLDYALSKLIGVQHFQLGLGQDIWLSLSSDHSEQEVLDMNDGFEALENLFKRRIKVSLGRSIHVDPLRKLENIKLLAP